MIMDGCEKLLENVNESYYWIGFILADGCIMYKKRLKINLHKQEKHHLNKFKKYIQCDNPLYHYKDYYEIQLMRTNIIPKICEKFDFKKQKTYNPPSLDFYESLDDDLFLSLIAGFIDGDGCVSKLKNRKHVNLKIHIHSSWLDFLILLENRIYKILNFKKDKTFSRIGKDGYANCNLTNNTVLVALKNKLIQLNIPLLERKWSKIDLNFISRQKVYPHPINVSL